MVPLHHPHYIHTLPYGVWWHNTILTIFTYCHMGVWCHNTILTIFTHCHMKYGATTPSSLYSQIAIWSMVPLNIFTHCHMEYGATGYIHTLPYGVWCHWLYSHIAIWSMVPLTIFTHCHMENGATQYIHTLPYGATTPSSLYSHIAIWNMVAQHHPHYNSHIAIWSMVPLNIFTHCHMEYGGTTPSSLYSHIAIWSMVAQHHPHYIHTLLYGVWWHNTILTIFTYGVWCHNTILTIFTQPFEAWCHYTILTIVTHRHWKHGATTPSSLYSHIARLSMMLFYNFLHSSSLYFHITRSTPKLPSIWSHTSLRMVPLHHPHYIHTLPYGVWCHYTILTIFTHCHMEYGATIHHPHYSHTTRWSMVTLHYSTLSSL